MTTTTIAEVLADTSEVLVIPAGRFQEPIVRFAETSPLNWCTSVKPLEHGGVAVITDRPLDALSSGERHLWRVLDSLVRGDLGQLLDRADQGTLASLGDLFARLTFAALS